MMFPKPQSRAFEKKTRARYVGKEQTAVLQQVRQRDRWRCRCCGSQKTVDVHHLRARSLGGGWTTQNLLCLCRIHHADRHAGRLYIHGLDANKSLLFEQWSSR